MINEIIAAATASLRGQYARDVVSGRQRWSGSDLRGKARKYGHTYYIQRRKARAALFAAGGCIIAIDHGLNVSAVAIDADSYMTLRGVAVRCGTRYRIEANVTDYYEGHAAWASLAPFSCSIHSKGQPCK